MNQLLHPVEEWEQDLVQEVESALNDMAELEDERVEAEATAFAARLFLEVTGADRKQAEAMAQILESLFSQGENQ